MKTQIQIEETARELMAELAKVNDTYQEKEFFQVLTEDNEEGRLLNACINLIVKYKFDDKEKRNGVIDRCIAVIRDFGDLTTPFGSHDIVNKDIIEELEKLKKS